MQLFSDVNSTLYFHKHRSKYNEINLNLLSLPQIYNLHQPTNKLYSLLCQLCTLFIFKLPVFLIPPPSSHHQPVPNPTSPLSLDRQLFDYPSLSQNPKPRPGRDEKQEPATRESRKKKKGIITIR